MRTRLLPVIGVVLALGFSSNSSMQSGVGIPRALMDRVASTGAAPVIVGLRTPLIAEGDLRDASAIAGQRDAVRRALDDVMARAEAKGVAIGRRFESIPFFTARVTAAELMELSQMPEIASIQEDLPDHILLADSVPLVSAPAAWAAGSNGAGWTVAVLDTGVDKTHPFLAGKVTAEACFSNAGGAGGGTSLCPGGATSSTAIGSGVNCDPAIGACDHGTHIAGIIAGTNGPSGMSGVAPGASIASIQVFTRGDDQTLCGTRGPTPCIVSFPSDQAAALDYVLTLAGTNNANQIAAVNMSLGGGRFFDPMGCAAANPSRAAGVANLRSIGIASVAPSGNDGYLNAVAAPACLPGVITVGSTSKSDVLSAFTNRWTYPIMAPGEGIFSSVPGGLYAAKSGTSAAAAHVAGAIAVLKQALPSASAGKIFVALSMSGKGISEPGNPLPQGFRLNVNAARINILTSGSDVPGVPGRPAAVVSGGSVTLSWAAPASGGAPTSYTVEAGTYSGGSNIGSFNLGNVTSITASPGPGVYYIRVRAANNYGVSDASAETTFSIGGGSVPGTPTNLAATVAGNTVTITWRPPSYGGAPSHYLLLAGTSPGSANLGSFNVGSTTTYTATPPPGTYYIRVVAVNAAGAGFSSTETWFTVGTTGAPGQPGTPVATVSGGSVTLTWDAPTTGGVATSYVLVVGSSSRSSNIGVFSMGPSRTVSATPAAGTYYVRAVAVNGSGQSPPSGEIAFSIGTPTTGNIDGTWNGQTNTGASVAVVVSGGVITQILAGGVLSSSCTRHTNDRDLAVPISGGSFTHTVAASSEHDGYTLSGTFNGSALSGTLTYTALLPGCSTGTATWTAANSGPGQPILPLEPTALNAAVGAGQVNLTWSAPGVNPPSTIAGPTMSYDIEVGTSSGASNIGVFASTETGYTVKNLANGTYYARVKARNASGTGRPSNEVSFAVSSSAPTYTGTWTGTTEQGKTITFTVNGGLIVSLNFGFTITGTAGCTYQGTAVATPDQPVSGNQFNWSVLSGDPTYAITGAFDTAGTASGRIYVTNAFSSECAGSTFFTWTATTP